MKKNDKLIDFGSRDIPFKLKKTLVNDIFHNVSNKYDLMNDLMSLGIHRLWKQNFVDWMAPRHKFHLVDLAGGTGDIGYNFLLRGGGKATIVDINSSMIYEGKNNKKYSKYSNKINWVISDAESISLKSSCADIVSISFGLRNISDRTMVLKEAKRLLKKGGRFMCLEFSSIKSGILKDLYDNWSSKVIPYLGDKIANDKESYLYLIESIRRFPDQESLSELIRSEGFSSVRYRNLSGGIVAIHSGWNY